MKKVEEKNNLCKQADNLLVEDHEDAVVKLTKLQEAGSIMAKSFIAELVQQ